MRFHIGNVIERIRKQQGITQAQLAAKAHVRPNTLGDLENRTKKTRLETLEVVAAALGRSVGSLYMELESGSEPASPQTANGLCPTDPEHRKYQIKLDQIFHKDAEKAGYIMGNVLTFYERLFPESAGDTPPKGDHGPGRPADDLGPGVPAPAKNRKKA